MIGLQECGPAPPRQVPGGSARERTAQAVDFYNSHVLKARVNAGLAAPRSSFNDRHHYHLSTPGTRRHHLAQDALYRSNSSLELQEPRNTNPSSPTLRRDYGSHGSIDVIDRPGPIPVPGTSESFFAMLQDYRPAVLGVISAEQRSPGPSEYLRGKVDNAPSTNAGTTDNGGANVGGGVSEVDGGAMDRTPHSPKLRTKLQRFWGGGGSGGAVNNLATVSKVQRQTMDDSAVSLNSCNSVASSSADIEERQRRRAFAHHDCQSLTANLGYAAKLRGLLLARRRNTTTGASAASMLTRSSTPDGDSGDEDAGDGQSNDLLDSCPFFRNEIGGEEERVVSLTRVLGNGQKNAQRRPLHRPPLAYGVAVLEFPPGETQWRHSTCPYHRIPRPIESVDQGALYYRKYFYQQEHQNWFGMDEQLGPVAISIRREKLQGSPHSDSNVQCQYRLVIRTSELLTLRGAILEDAIPSIRSSNSSKTMNTKEVLEFVVPEIQMGCLRLGAQSSQTEEQVLKLDEQGLTNHYKVGIMYCKAGQSTEEEMYNNEEAGPAFTEFLETIAQKVRLKGFDKYKAGLDNKTDSTGLYSMYAQYQECEIMFHVSTMLPFTPNNRQQLLRKRHIGNDIVTIVFQEPGALPFTPKSIRSQFQHVFIIVRAINPCTENTHYSVAVSRSKDVQVFGPPIKKGAIFPKSKTFADFLLAKIVNAENAAHRSDKFVTMATRTRQEYLKDLAGNYCTTTVVDTGQKFSIFSSKKKEKTRPIFISDSCQRGAICWQVILDDSGQSQQIECYLGVSTDTLVLIEECSRQIVFVTPCKAILGWSPQANSIRVYHHQGECTTMHMRDSTGDRDELMEIMDRLRAVTQGCLAQELSLRRNSMGQLGFHVQPDGVVTQVENLGQAWQAGLRQGSRLVEICKVAVSTLSHDQMVDLLKTSMLVTVTVIPPLADNTPRRGCTLHSCKYNSGTYEGDYENLNTDEAKCRKGAQLQQAQAVPGNHRRRYERSFSPPRSSNSSGYGTGSSSKSFLAPDTRFPTNPEGTMTSSSSGHSSDDRWYELLETPEHDTGVLTAGVTPPPLPARVVGCNNPSPVRNNQLMSSAFVTPKQLNLGHSITQLRTQNHVHNKLQQVASPHVGGGGTSNYSLPLNAAQQQSIYSDCDYNNYHAKQLDKINANKIQNDLRLSRSQQQQQLLDNNGGGVGGGGDYMAHRAAAVINDGHSTDSSILSDRLFGIGGSEDELSNGSGGNVSPRLRRAAATSSSSSSSNQQQKHRNNLTTSANNSRNNSPRSLNGEAKLRPGVTPRSSNRNSANLSTNNNLQENLMKLIDPDYVLDDGGGHEPPPPPPLAAPQNSDMMYHSRETLNNQSLSIHHQNGSQAGSKAAEVILTMARPATVISNASTTSSPLPIEFKTGKDADRLSPRVNKNNVGGGGAEVLPLPGDINWPSLVDTATRAMRQVHIEPADRISNKESNVQWNEDIDRGLPIDASITSMVSSSVSVPELQNHLSELETRVSHETRRRLSLEDEVRRLRDENQRLQDESQAAAHQLRKFTEWFFKNIDRQ